MTRHEAREVAFIIAFQKQFQKDATVEDIIAAAGEVGGFDADDFSLELANRVFDNISEIDTLISENLVRWSLDRISKVSHAILQISVAEIKYSDIPIGIAVNEAVELAKKYSTQQDASFINGVLASVSKAVRS